MSTTTVGSDNRYDERAETWRPTEGKVLVGTLERVQEVETDYGATRVAHLRCPETGNLLALWLSHKVLSVLWDEHAPAEGDAVHVAYLGMRDGQRYPYHDYELHVERGASTCCKIKPDDGADERSELPY